MARESVVRKETHEFREADRMSENIGEKIIRQHGHDVHMSEHIPHIPNVTRHMPRR
jgi:hypothetical protein